MSEWSVIRWLARRVGLDPDDQPIPWSVPLAAVAAGMCVAPVLAVAAGLFGRSSPDPSAWVPMVGGFLAIMAMTWPSSRLRACVPHWRAGAFGGFVVLLVPPLAVLPWVSAAPLHHQGP